MKSLWAALIFVLALSVVTVAPASAQSSPPNQSQAAPSPSSSLGQNFPNPYNPETFIPFSVAVDAGQVSCADPAKPHVVTLTIRNILNQVLANPILMGGGANAGRPINKLSIPCGQYRAYYDGKLGRTTTEAASGNYIYMLEIDGKTVAVKSMTIAK